jgi:tetratricopeptide (TPR) repeat protein
MKLSYSELRSSAKPMVALLAAFLLLGCDSIFSQNIPRFGIGGKYNEGKEQFLRGRGGDMDRGVAALETVVREDPTYYDALTLLGRAYYRKGRFKDADQVLRRALVVNKEDEIAWVALGMTELQLGQNDRGLATLKGGITLLSKAAQAGYKNYPDWDTQKSVRSAISRSALEISKGIEAKAEILRACDTLLARIDDEENFQKNTTPQNQRRESGY